ncbi:hypothetical protein ACSIGC_00595 [Tenacibaculum sp. ZS6-P6]|uniref:hypothetical protein n=1 Tax=Tenacibaculum sp. ZS6-P6 TaxID=3447503 RepID=UPI003F9B126A
MKNLIILIALLSSTLTFANDITIPSKELKKELRTEIVKLLNNEKPDINLDFTVKVDFMINEKNEIVIIDINTSDTVIESFVKRKLNYKAIQASTISKGKIYQLPIKFVKQ